MDCIYRAPAPKEVPKLMEGLFGWLRDEDVHPLIKSCVFHYEFELIHPFLDGNGRVGRLWHTLILSKWNPVFAWLPVASMIYRHQQEFCHVAGRKKFTTDYLSPLLADGRLTMTLPDKPRSRGQRYVAKKQ